MRLLFLICNLKAWIGDRSLKLVLDCNFFKHLLQTKQNKTVSVICVHSLSIGMQENAF